MEDHSLFRRFKDAARLKHLDPSGISSNYQCPIFVYKICHETGSTYLLCTSQIDVSNVLKWAKRQGPVSEYNVRLNEVQTGWFTKTKSVFIRDVRYFENNMKLDPFSFSLNQVESGDLKIDESVDPNNYVKLLQWSNRMQLSFNYEERSDDSNDRDCLKTFRTHWESIQWEDRTINALVKDSKIYGLTKFVLPSIIDESLDFEQNILSDDLQNDVLLILRPIDVNYNQFPLHMYILIHNYHVGAKPIRAIMHNADQFLLDLNNISQLPEYDEDSSEYSDISNFKNECEVDFMDDLLVTENSGPILLVRMPLLVVVDYSCKISDQDIGQYESLYNKYEWPKMFILSTNSQINIASILYQKFPIYQEKLVVAHRPFRGHINEEFQTQGFILAFGEQCENFNSFCRAYYPDHGDLSDSEVDKYLSRGIFIGCGLDQELYRENVLEILRGTCMGSSNYPRRSVVYSYSTIEIPNSRDIVLIFKQCDLGMKFMISNFLCLSVTRTQLINECFFLEDY